jgi:hypothetical protein
MSGWNNTDFTGPVVEARIANALARLLGDRLTFSDRTQVLLRAAIEQFKPRQ